MSASILGTPATTVDFQAGTGLAYTAESGSNRRVLLIGGSEAAGSRTLTAATHGGTGGTVITSNNPQPAFIAHWADAAVPADAQNFAITWSGTMASGQGRAVAMTVAGLDQGTALRNAAQTFSFTAPGNGSTVSFTGQAVEAGDIAVVVLSTDLSNARYTLAGYTEHFDGAINGSNSALAVYTKVISLAGTETPAPVCDAGSSNGGAVFAVFQGATSGGGDDPSIIVAPRRQVFVIDKTIQH